MFKAVAAIVLVAIGAPAWAQMTPEGLWRSVDDKTGEAKAEIRIRDTGAAGLLGVLEKRLSKDAKPDDLCKECSDDRKDKPVLGMEIIRGAKKAEDKDVWEGGKILDPENGRNYTLRLTPVDSGKKLEVRGSIGPFGRTQTWIRLQ
ncbi:DUF2147 domain-containing protein [Acidovorax sp. 106]|uniref:DUF2147 domain-containing protein n=1 Tax=Acidovorax sp. 106 TaxID=2135637 RepID=UPI000EADEE95|nr:DUF2147 domain-containing protein [Acidovorax sp. 106]RLJ38491.1 uncharacterized protein (DUF2147 family) [Acidovorax sp. 106]